MDYADKLPPSPWYIFAPPPRYIFPPPLTLNAGGTNTVGAVIPTINHAIFAAFLEALEARLDTNGYCLLIATTGTDL